jgi:hemolysin III
VTASDALEASAEAVRRRLSRWEIGVDGAIHVCAIVAGIVGAIVLILVARVRGGGAAEFAVTGIYSAALVAMLGCSAAYNLARETRHGWWLRNLDQVAIFLMIAGTYTPFTVLHLTGVWSVSTTTMIWACAGLGILVRLLNGRLFERLSTGLYLVLGWMALVMLSPLLASLDLAAVILLAIGGGLYTVGVIFHLWERLPFQTAIWHLFVVAAAAVHYAAVLVSLPSASPL